MAKNALKLTYDNVELNKIPGENSHGPPIKGWGEEGRRGGRNHIKGMGRRGETGTKSAPIKAMGRGLLRHW